MDLIVCGRNPNRYYLLGGHTVLRKEKIQDRIPPSEGRTSPRTRGRARHCRANYNQMGIERWVCLGILNKLEKSIASTRFSNHQQNVFAIRIGLSIPVHRLNSLCELYSIRIVRGRHYVATIEIQASLCPEICSCAEIEEVYHRRRGARHVPLDLVTDIPVWRTYRNRKRSACGLRWRTGICHAYEKTIITNSHGRIYCSGNKSLRRERESKWKVAAVWKGPAERGRSSRSVQLHVVGIPLR